LPDVRPRVTGELEILNGHFMFDKFPYPLRNVIGKIVIAYDSRTGEESLQLDHIRGYGVGNGPNADKVVEINGAIGPFGPDARADIIIAALDVKSEPAIFAAFPPMTRKALTLFDAPGKGEFPKFAGDFACNVIRLRGRDSHWIIDTNIHLDDAAGSLVGFPYPMSGVSGDLKVHEDSLEMSNITMNRKDGASLKIDGSVSWPNPDSPQRKSRPDDGPALRTDIKVVAKNVPIDRDLLNALPPERQRELLDFAEFLLLKQEQRDWQQSGADHFAQCYGPDEPDYDDAPGAVGGQP